MVKKIAFTGKSPGLRNEAEALRYLEMVECLYIQNFINYKEKTRIRNKIKKGFNVK